MTKKNKKFIAWFSKKIINKYKVRPAAFSKTFLHNLKNFDSLELVNLILEIEKLFKVKFSAKELGSLKTLGDLFKTCDSKINVKN